MTSENGMEWLEASGPVDDPHVAALEAVGTAARLHLYNEVRAVFDKLLRERKTTRAKLAEKLGTSVEAVAKLLRRPSNMTIETAARLLFVMDHELRVAASDPKSEVRAQSFEWDCVSVGFSREIDVWMKDAMASHFVNSPQDLSVIYFHDTYASGHLPLPHARMPAPPVVQGVPTTQSKIRIGSSLTRNAPKVRALL